MAALFPMRSLWLYPPPPPCVTATGGCQTVNNNNKIYCQHFSSRLSVSDQNDAVRQSSADSVLIKSQSQTNILNMLIVVNKAKLHV